MALSVTCPGCKATLRVKEELAGKKVKCPRCEAAVPISAAAPVEAVVVEEEPDRPAARARTKACPECGKQVAAEARKCRWCKTWLEDKAEPPDEAGPEQDDEERDDEDDRRRPRWKPCPECGASGARRVKKTIWGSVYGPALFSHVRCPECGYAYNGKTGRSNLVPAVVCLSLAVLLIVGLFGVAAYILYTKLKVLFE